MVERMAALERLFPPHMERLKQSMRDGGGGAGVSGAVSTRSAPEGSLLNRLEVLEEGMASLLAAQEVSLQYQQELLTQAQTARAGGKTDGVCCCTVM